MFHRKDSCLGITLFRWFRWKLEIWFVPSNYECAEHVHKDSDGEFFVLYGKDRDIYRVIGQHQIDENYDVKHIQQYNISNRTFFKWLTVKANVPHGFSKGATPMIFLCLEHYKPGVKVTSPAVDFHLTTT